MLGLCLVLFSLSRSAAYAEGVPIPSPPMVRRTATSLLRGLTDKIDELFGTERFDENRQFSTLRLSYRHTIIDGGPNEISTGVRLTLRPATFDHWAEQVDEWLKRKKSKARDYLWRRRGDSDSAPLVPGPDEAPSLVDDGSGERDPWRLAFEQRIRLSRDDFFSGRMKIAKDFELSSFFHHLAYDLRWSHQQRWESGLSTISSYSLSESLLFQFSNSFTWQILTSKIESSHGPSLAYILSPNQAISLSATAVVSYDPWWVNVYTIASLYRIHIYEDWIDLAVNPYQSFSRARRFLAETGVVVSAEFMF